MIEVLITVMVDGITYAVNKEKPVVPGRNNTKQAMDFFDKQVILIKQAIQAHLPTESKVTDDRPVVEYRNVDSGPIDMKPTRGAEGNVNANPGPYS